MVAAGAEPLAVGLLQHGQRPLRAPRGVLYYDTYLYVVTGDCGFTQLACNDDFCGLQSQVQFVANGGQTYFILVDGYFDDAGPFTLNVSGVPCAAPEAPDSLVVQLGGVNINLYWPPVPGAASYKVYRKVTPDVAPVPADFLANAATNNYVDVGAINAAPKYFYLVTAMTAAGQPAAPKKLATVEGITEYQLPNGTKFLLFPDPSASTVTVNMTVLVGSRHEGYGECQPECSLEVRRLDIVHCGRLSRII